MAASKELAQRILNVAELHGEFLLRSGATSDTYFDKYQFESDPSILKDIAAGMAEMIPEGTQMLGALEMGGIPIATMISQMTGLPVLFVRKKAKEYGTCKFAEGPDPNGKNLLIIEDVVTSGGQIIISTKDLRDLGAKVDTALCVINREAGGEKKLAAEGIALRALYTRSNLEALRG